MDHIKILLFANLRDYAGTKLIELEIPSGTTLHELTNLLVEKYPRLDKVRDSMITAVNREYTADEQVIPDGAEIAYFPPVSGG
jgi:molybdopterin converting factor subunit 1